MTFSDSIVLAAGLRTPWARAGGAFSGEDAAHLGAATARELLARTDLDPSLLNEVIAGCVGPAHDQANVARVIALRAGVPWRVPARTVGRNCASGIEAVTEAATSIVAGHGDLYLCLGVEVMSSYPLIVGRKMTRMFARLAAARTLGAKLSALAKFRPSFLAPRVALLEGLRDPVVGLLMGQTAEVLARDFGITRAEADAYALRSHERAAAARAKGRFEREIVAHLPLAGDGRPPEASLAQDDAIREDQSPERLGKLKPYFEKPDGIVTVGNACGITDGACALLVTTATRARELGLRPLAKLRSWSWVGLDPSRMGLGPVFASAEALRLGGVELSDIGVVELNEAFAAQVLACERAFASDAFAKQHLQRERALGTLDPARLNPNGGAIALGHPVGATGARLLLTTAHELQHGDHELGLATLCIGGGQGGAVLLERIAA
ncbi:MAG: acetyl-CoA C-acyltransferase [Planctomycetes bacterium]|nr:acetyl-CoA C-acyltransferase [Planctomycetota bacterium]